MVSGCFSISWKVVNKDWQTGARPSSCQRGRLPERRFILLNDQRFFGAGFIAAVSLVAMRLRAGLTDPMNPSARDGSLRLPDPTENG